MKRYILTALFAVTCSSQARLGETTDGLVARYGAVKASRLGNPDQFAFASPDAHVVATVYKGKCVKLSYFKHNAETWSQSEIENITRAAVPPDFQAWKPAPDGGFCASFKGDTVKLLIVPTRPSLKPDKFAPLGQSLEFSLEPTAPALPNALAAPAQKRPAIAAREQRPR
jgi:hypothetical protein